MRYLAPLLAFLVTVLGTDVLRREALKKNRLDVPNARSSHAIPTPRGGGLAIVVAATAAFGGLSLFANLEIDLLLALIGGGGAVAIVGFLDDRHQLSARVRLAVHFAAALWALAWLGGLPPLQVGDHFFIFGWIGYVLGALSIVWTLNLFNFMDGIDGIAASEAMFIAWGAALLTLVSGLSSPVASVGIVFGAACCGFLLWNWSPAKIFMGDVGSGYIGYVIAVLAVAATFENPVALWAWLILGGVFFVDTGVTLVRRSLRRERVYEAHRSHAYQRLARRWGSHGRVTVAVVLVNLTWLLPCAWLAMAHPRHAVWIAIVALAPLVIAAIAIGAGQPENRT